MMTNQQQQRLAELRAEFAEYADAARELDSCITTLVNRGSTTSREAHELAVEKLREMLTKTEVARDAAADQLRAEEGWLTCR